MTTEAAFILEESSQRTLEVRERYHRWITQRLGKGRRSPVRVVIGLLLMCTGALIPVGLFLVVKGLVRRNPHKRLLEEEAEFIEQAEAVMAVPLMVNSMLRRPGDRPVPGLFIISFEGGEAQTTGFMTEVATAVLRPGAGNAVPDADIEAIVAIMADETFQRGRRRQLPGTVTRGYAVYACDLAVHPWYLVGQHLSDAMPFVPCLAEPGPEGRIRAVPYWCITDGPWPEIASRCPVMRI